MPDVGSEEGREESVKVRANADTQEAGFRGEPRTARVFSASCFDHITHADAQDCGLGSTDALG